MEPKDAAQSSSFQCLLGWPANDLIQEKQFKQIQRCPATQMFGKSLNCAFSTPPASIKQLAAEFQKMHRTGVKYSTKSGNQSKWHSLPTAPGKQERSTLRCFQASLQQILSFSWQPLPKTGHTLLTGQQWKNRCFLMEYSMDSLGLFYIFSRTSEHASNQKARLINWFCHI